MSEDIIALVLTRIHKDGIKLMPLIELVKMVAPGIPLSRTVLTKQIQKGEVKGIVLQQSPTSSHYFYIIPKDEAERLLRQYRAFYLEREKHKGH